MPRAGRASGRVASVGAEPAGLVSSSRAGARLRGLAGRGRIIRGRGFRRGGGRPGGERRKENQESNCRHGPVEPSYFNPLGNSPRGPHWVGDSLGYGGDQSTDDKLHRSV